MKLSIAWIFDHIDADWKKVDIQHLTNEFNQKVAEIEGFEKKTTDLESLTIGQVTQFDDSKVVLLSKEWNQECILPARKGVNIGQHFLIKRHDAGLSWALAQDMGGDKDAIMPAVDSDGSSDWKQSFEAHDYILHIDNKSITHRPDMWGHRGFAREIAALLDLPFKPLSEFLVHKEIKQYTDRAEQPIAVAIQAPQACKRFAGMMLSDIKHQSSSLWMAHRLARVDARAIDAIVDITNYVMWDLGQPMHAFDTEKLDSLTLIPRMAKNKEKLILLDGETIELTDQDLVISDDIKPLALAGVMGGRDSGISSTTSSIVIESACFDAATVRRTATRYKKRSEASARFEKSLDPNQNTTAIQRFLKLFHDSGMQGIESDEIFSLGEPAPETVITISHEMIESRLGVTLAPEFVQNTLLKLEFGVRTQDGVYTIGVPTFRGTKDVKIKEDIIEEIGRYYGYTVLEPRLPLMQLKPTTDSGWVYQQRTIKHTLAYAGKMRELYTYAFFDEEFLQQLNWQPTNTLEVQSPVSENWRRLVTSLIPNILKVVVASSTEHDSLRFFELARIWHHGAQTTEKKSLAGILFDKKSVDFYDAKAQLHTLFEALKLDVQWVKVNQPDAPWYAPYQTAHLMHNDTKIGTAGKLHPTFLSALCPGDAFIFELDADFLLHYKSVVHRFMPSSKYPEMVRDISVLISVDQTVDALLHLIAQVDPKIINVALLDFFSKDEWPDKRAMTFRFVISDYERTMTKEEADAIWDNVAAQLKNVGATIR